MIARVHIRVYYKGKTRITHDACTLQKPENKHILSLSNPVLWYQIFLFEIRRGACGGSECVQFSEVMCGHVSHACQMIVTPATQKKLIIFWYVKSCSVKKNSSFLRLHSDPRRTEVSKKLLNLKTRCRTHSKPSPCAVTLSWSRDLSSLLFSFHLVPYHLHFRRSRFS
jgi:hypothetical protein